MANVWSDFCQGKRSLVWSRHLLMLYVILVYVTSISRAARIYNNPPYSVEYLTKDCAKFSAENDDPEEWNLRVRSLSQEGNKFYGYVKVTNESAYQGPLDCAIKVVAPSNYTLTVRIPTIEIYHDDTGCDRDYMSITGASDALHYCGFGTVQHSIYSTSNWLIFSIHVSSSQRDLGYHGFTLYYTALHAAPCNTNTNVSEWRCKKSDRCTPAEVTCDNNDNCGQWEDEKSNVCGLTTGAIAAITVVCALVGGAIVFFTAYCLYDKRKTKRQQERRQQEMAAIRYSAPGVVAGLPGGPPVSGPLTEPPPPYTPAAYDNHALDPTYEFLTLPNQVPSEQSVGNGVAPPVAGVTPTSLNVRLTTAARMRPPMGEPPPFYTLHDAANTDGDTANQATGGAISSTARGAADDRQSADDTLSGACAVSNDPLPEKADDN